VLFETTYATQAPRHKNSFVGKHRRSHSALSPPAGASVIVADVDEPRAVACFELLQRLLISISG